MRWSIIAQIRREFAERHGMITEEQLVGYLSLAKDQPFFPSGGLGVS